MIKSGGTRIITSHIPSSFVLVVILAAAVCILSLGTSSGQPRPPGVPMRPPELVFRNEFLNWNFTVISARIGNSGRVS